MVCADVEVIEIVGVVVRMYSVVEVVFVVAVSGKVIVVVDVEFAVTGVCCAVVAFSTDNIADEPVSEVVVGIELIFSECVIVRDL